MGVLCKFKKYPYAIAWDVEKMFHQLFECKNDRVLAISVVAQWWGEAKSKRIKNEGPFIWGNMFAWLLATALNTREVKRRRYTPQLFSSSHMIFV